MNEKESLLLIQTVKHDKKPITPDVVRAQVIRLQYLRVDDANKANMRVVDFTCADFKGYFPSRLMNMTLGHLMSKAMSEITNKLKEVQG